MTSTDETGLQGPSLSAAIGRAARGDREAFRIIVETYHEDILRMAYRFLRDRDAACDVAQDAWIRIWKHLPRYRPEIKFTTWSYRIVTRLCLDSIRSEKRRRISDAELVEDWPESQDGTGIEQSIEERDLCRHILSCARELPPKEMLVFQLRDVQDLELSEIAGIMDISESAVRANLCHARKRLRAKLQELKVSRTS